MTEGNVFTLSTIAWGGGDRGGLPCLADDGTPSSPDGGVYKPSFLSGGYPHSSRQGWIRPSGGYPPPIRTGWGYIPSGLDGGTPWRQETEQQNEHLLRGARCASCFHVGRLSSLY